MIVIGLTGSIGTGKSAAAAALRRIGCRVHDADRAVHRLMARGGAAVEAVAKTFPGIVKGGSVDRQALAELVFADQSALRRLERIIHPLVRADSRRALAAASRQRARVMVLDVPLLFESGGERRCDATIALIAPLFVVDARVLCRRGMTPARLAAIRARQMSDRDKMRRADFTVSTGLSRRESLRQLGHIVRILRQRHGRVWRRPA